MAAQVPEEVITILQVQAVPAAVLPAAGHAVPRGSSFDFGGGSFGGGGASGSW